MREFLNELKNADGNEGSESAADTATPRSLDSVIECECDDPEQAKRMLEEMLRSIEQSKYGLAYRRIAKLVTKDRTLQIWSRLVASLFMLLVLGDNSWATWPSNDWCQDCAGWAGYEVAAGLNKNGDNVARRSLSFVVSTTVTCELSGIGSQVTAGPSRVHSRADNGPISPKVSNDMKPNTMRAHIDEWVEEEWVEEFDGSVVVEDVGAQIRVGILREEFELELAH
ncbi:hypothetical protein Tco_0240622 [Tanacetum coccineum]